MNIKKKLKEIVEETFSWVSDPKGSDDFNDDLNITDEELGDLKEPIEDEFGIKIKRGEIRNCIDINALTRLVQSKKFVFVNPDISVSNTGLGNKGGTLEEDLIRYKNELYDNDDIIKGIGIIAKIGAEVGGVVSVATFTIALLKVFSGILAPVGLTIGTGVVARYVTTTIHAYANLDTQERKEVRVAIRWIRRTFGIH